jgi:hypothetical protein
MFVLTVQPAPKLRRLNIASPPMGPSPSARVDRKAGWRRGTQDEMGVSAHHHSPTVGGSALGARPPLVEAATDPSTERPLGAPKRHRCGSTTCLTPSGTPVS